MSDQQATHDYQPPGICKLCHMRSQSSRAPPRLICLRCSRLLPSQLLYISSYATTTSSLCPLIPKVGSPGVTRYLSITTRQSELGDNPFCIGTMTITSKDSRSPRGYSRHNPYQSNNPPQTQITPTPYTHQNPCPEASQPVPLDLDQGLVCFSMGQLWTLASHY